jgi:hypothetical protein
LRLKLENIVALPCILSYVFFMSGILKGTGILVHQLRYTYMAVFIRNVANLSYLTVSSWHIYRWLWNQSSETAIKITIFISSALVRAPRNGRFQELAQPQSFNQSIVELYRRRFQQI